MTFYGLESAFRIAYRRLGRSFIAPVWVGTAELARANQTAFGAQYRSLDLRIIRGHIGYDSVTLVDKLQFQLRQVAPESVFDVAARIPPSVPACSHEDVGIQFRAGTFHRFFGNPFAVSLGAFGQAWPRRHRQHQYCGQDRQLCHGGPPCSESTRACQATRPCRPAEARMLIRRMESCKCSVFDVASVVFSP